MTLPFRFDPWSWVFTVPMLAFLIWCYHQPDQFLLKRLWCHMVRSQAEGWASLLRLEFKNDPARPSFFGKMLFWSIVVFLSVNSLLGVGVCIGVFQLPPHPFAKSIEGFDPEDVEIIIEDGTMRGEVHPNNDIPLPATSQPSGGHVESELRR